MIIIFEEIAMNDLMKLSEKHTIVIATALPETCRQALVDLLIAYDIGVAALYMAPHQELDELTKMTMGELITALREKAIKDGWA